MCALYTVIVWIEGTLCVMCINIYIYVSHHGHKDPGSDETT